MPACKVAVTSANTEKLAAIESAFHSHFAQQGQARSITMLPCPADSGIPHGQPWGMQHTYEGAQSRLTHLKSSGAGAAADYYVSAENGVCALLRHDATLALDVACVIVERACDGKEGMNFSQGRPYPLQEIQQMKRAGSSNA
ncbi:Prrc1, partial [Symbiodinium pilosum]